MAFAREINTTASSSAIHCYDNDRYQKAGGWKIEKEPTRNGNVSTFASRPFECQMCSARRQSARTLLSSSQLIFFFFSVPSSSGPYIQLSYSVWEPGLQHVTEQKLTMTHCLFSVWVQLTEWFQPELLCWLNIMLAIKKQQQQKTDYCSQKNKSIHFIPVL